MWGLLKSLEMVLLLGSIRQEAKKNDFLAESEETGKEFTQTDARNPELLRLGEISRGRTQSGHRERVERRLHRVGGTTAGVLSGSGMCQARGSLSWRKGSERLAQREAGFLGSLDFILNTRKFIVEMNMVMRQRGSRKGKEKLAGCLINFSILRGKKKSKLGPVIFLKETQKLCLQAQLFQGR